MVKKENFNPGDLCCLYPTRPLNKSEFVIVIEEFSDQYSLLTLSKNLQEKQKKSIKFFSRQAE